MPDEFPDLPPLTGPSLAALMPPPALLELIKLAPSLVAPQFPAPLSAPERLPFELNRVREMMGPASSPAPAPPPAVPPARSQPPGTLEVVLRMVAPALAVLGSSQPGETAARFLSEDAARRERERTSEITLQDQFRREQREDRIRAEETTRADERFIKQAALESAITGEREDRAAAATEERDRRLFDQQMKKALGEQGFQASQAELDRVFKTQQEEARRKLEKEKLDLQLRQQRNQLSKEYRRLGAGKFTKELVSFDIGMDANGNPVTTLSAEAQAKADKIGRLQEFQARGGRGGAGGSGRVLVELVDAQGNVLGQMPYDRLKFTQEGDVQGFGQGVTLRFPPQAQAGGGRVRTPEQEIRDYIASSQAAKMPQAEIARQVRRSPLYAVHRDLAERLIADYKLLEGAAPSPGIIERAGAAIRGAEVRALEAIPKLYEKSVFGGGARKKQE